MQSSLRSSKFNPSSIFSILSAVAACVFLFGSSLGLDAQERNPTSVAAPRGAIVDQNGDIFFYKVQVVRRDIDAVNYLHRSGATHINFVGTNLLPNASGKAEVKSERGKITVNADFKGLTPANGFGPEYLTYVLWAISPDGNPKNLGEVLPAGTKNNLSVSVPIQAFGLIVTAEPYYAVSTPSDIVVLKNVFSDRTDGVLEHVNAKATLLPRGAYLAETDGAHTVSNPVTRNEHSPLELYEAYNALRIADATGAEKYSPSIIEKAKTNLTNASEMDQNKHRDEKMEITYARAAVEGAEDARIDTLRKKAAERQQNAEIARNQAQEQAVQAQAQAAQAQLQAEQAQADAARAAAAKAQADAERSRAEADAANARAQAAEANKSVQDANAIREKLRQQLNSVLQTSDSARGLIVNMSDVLFDTGKYSLKQPTQISLAKVAGILQAYPGLKLQVEGYTDSVGTPELNQKLSENRAAAVRDFLVSQGVQMTNISATGFGEAKPVADNSTAAGRAQNRRVQLVVSGDAIGISTQAAQ